MTEALTLSPLIAWITALSLILNFGLTIYSLISSGAKANAKQLERHDARLSKLEQALSSVPAKDDLHGLQISLERMHGQLRTMGAVMEGNSKIMERLETIVSRHEDHLLDGSKR